MNEKYPNEEKKESIRQENIYLGSGAAYDPNRFPETPTSEDLLKGTANSFKTERKINKKLQL